MRNDKYIKEIENAIEYAKNGTVCNVYNWQDILQSKNVCAFGLGKFFEDTHQRLFNMCHIKYLCDNDKAKIEKYSKMDEYKMKEIKCITPDELKGIDNIFVIAVVGNYEPIFRQMEEIGVQSIHISEMHFKDYLKGRDTKWLADALPHINKALELLEDDKSREVFTSVFCNKIHRSLAPLKYSELYSEGEYFTTGILNISSDENFVDAGAYDGDTINDFIKVTKSKFENIYSFEINTGNFKLLEHNVTTLDPSISEKIHLYNYGVWIKEDEMWCAFEGDSDGCGVVSEARGERCKLVSLDNFLANKKVSIIKMDIEGAEISALEGARNIIMQQNPKLAICAYHRPEDLWEIPLKIKDLNCNYKVYLRHHNPQNYTDTVCYAHV